MVQDTSGEQHVPAVLNMKEYKQTHREKREKNDDKKKKKRVKNKEAKSTLRNGRRRREKITQRKSGLLTVLWVKVIKDLLEQHEEFFLYDVLSGTVDCDDTWILAFSLLPQPRTTSTTELNL